MFSPFVFPQTHNLNLHSHSHPMPLPTLAIVGRPNVGKSTLFNRLVGRKHAIVYDQPGVTRDRNYAPADWRGFDFRIVDTGGYEVEPTSDLYAQMRRQAEIAIQESDLVALVVDGRAGITADDRDMAERLRRMGKKTLLVINKIDSSHQEEELSEFYSLGFQKNFGVSAEHGREIGELLDAIVDELSSDGTENFHFKPTKKLKEENLNHLNLKEKNEDDARVNEDKNKTIRIAILGRPNVGKSTLLNRLYGAPRAVVHPQPGTTRDPLEIEIPSKGKVFRIVDTAGIRKKSHAEGKIEKVSVMKSFEIVERGDVVVMLIDASVGITAQDAKIAEQVLERGRGLLLLVNKWDLVSDQLTWTEAKKVMIHRYDFLKYIPALKISAKTGQGLSKLFDEILNVYKEYSKRLTTGELNRVFRKLIEAHPAPTVSGKNINLFFMTQVAARPPYLVIFCNHPDLIPKSYERYLIRGIRESFSFRGSPLLLEFRSRKKKAFHA